MYSTVGDRYRVTRVCKLYGVLLLFQQLSACTHVRGFRLCVFLINILRKITKL